MEMLILNMRKFNKKSSNFFQRHYINKMKKAYPINHMHASNCVRNPSGRFCLIVLLDKQHKHVYHKLNKLQNALVWRKNKIKKPVPFCALYILLSLLLQTEKTTEYIRNHIKYATTHFWDSFSWGRWIDGILYLLKFNVKKNDTFLRDLYDFK